MKKRDWRKELWKMWEAQDRMKERLRKTRERKKKRRPSQWGPEEKSNPDYQWLEFLKMAEAHGLLPAKESRLTAAKAYLRPSRRLKDSPETPLSRGERKRLLKELEEYMTYIGLLPAVKWYRKICKEIRKKQ